MRRFLLGLAAALLMFAALGAPAAFGDSDRCLEAEHAGDPDCDADRSGSDDDDNSGSGSSDDDDDDNSGPGSSDDDDDADDDDDGDEDNSGPGSSGDDDDDDGDDDDDSPSPSPSPSASASNVAIASGSVSDAAFAAAAAPKSGTVTILDDEYSPQSYEIAQGGTVNWKQTGDKPHTVTADDGSFDSGLMTTGKAFSHTFSKPGTFRYFCEFHGGKGGDGMAGTIVVKAASGGAARPADDTGTDATTGTGGGSEVAGETTSAGARSGGLARTGVAIAAIFGLAVLAIGVGLALRKAARAR